MAVREAAASKIAAVQRGRKDRQLFRLHSLGERVASHYRQNLASVGHEANDFLAIHGAVMQLDGRLLKQSGLSWQPRAVKVDNLQFKYASKHGDTKSIDLVEVDRLAIVSEDRFEFAIYKRSGVHHTFRAATRDQFVSWTSGLQSYVEMAQAYYTL